MMKKYLVFSLVFICFLSACSSTPKEPPKPIVTFIDLQKFDDQLSSSLSGIKDPVAVNFYSPVTPNEIPQRMQKWLAMIEQSGGRIDVTSPAGEPTPKDPTIIFSLFGSMFSGIRALIGQYDSMNMEKIAKNRDANIMLGRNSQGNIYIQKIEFKQRDTK